MNRRTSRLVRAVAAFLVLPGTVAFLVPLLVGARPGEGFGFRWIGLIALVPGIALLMWCVRTFFAVGEGTLAPWDPPRHLVVSGPYRASRNPMYIAVLLIVVGWALAFRSGTLLVYALVLAPAFHARVLFGEEPALSRAFGEVWTRYRRRTPRWLFPTRRSLALTLAALLVALPPAGLMFEAYADARAAREFPPPGMLVDVGGRRLHVVCTGAGEPTVLFESSGWGNSLSASQVRDRVATRVRVCSYDRIGMGWSDPGSGVATPADLARDLAVLQDRAQIGSPVVLVASSVGGLTAEMFARKYPERVAGLVFLDAASSEVLPAARAFIDRAGTPGACVVGFLARFGVMRVIDPFGLEGPGASEQARRSAAVTYGARPWATVCAIARGLRRDPSAFDRVPPLPADVPLLVLSASSGEGLFPGSRWLPSGLAAERVASHRRLAQRSHRGAWRMVPDSTHLIAESQPDVVADAVLAMVNELK